VFERSIELPICRAPMRAVLEEKWVCQVDRSCPEGHLGSTEHPVAAKKVFVDDSGASVWPLARSRTCSERTKRLQPGWTGRP
jgi:hypothetical protein